MEAPITRTCSTITLIAALLATAPAYAKPGANASARVHHVSPYVFVRMTGDEEADAKALPKLAEGLKATPGDQKLAQRVVREAVIQGDFALAARAAKGLSLGQDQPSDILIFLLAQRVKAGDYRGAGGITESIDATDGFRFLVPFARAWLAMGVKGGDIIAELNAVPRQSPAYGYVNEHRAYALLATGKTADGLTMVRALALTAGGLPALRVSAASTLLKAGNKDGALALLQPDQPALAAAADLVKSGKPLPAPVRTTAQGLAQMFARLSGDLIDEKAVRYALLLARLGRQLDGANPFVALAEAKALAAFERYKEADGSFERLASDPLVAAAARDARVDVLEKLGRKDDAAALAASLASDAPSDASAQARLGDLLGRNGKFTEAANAYSAALKAANAGDSGVEIWLLHYLLGIAHERSGNWQQGETALRQAIALAPNQPSPLNHLGYTLLERKEKLPEALKLIKQASALSPDDVSIRDSLGWALYLNGDLESAADALEEAVAESPGEPALQEHLGDVYWSLGRKIDARYAWNAAAVWATETDQTKRLADKIDIGLPR